MRRRWAIGAATLAALATAPAARGQEPGVHVDPGSPAGKEYAIPIERARREAAGGTGISAVKSAAQPAVAVPIFGAGIKPEKPKPRRRERTRGSRPQRAAPRRDGVASPAVQAALRTPSTTGWTAGIIGAVVLAAALVALALRPRRS